VNLQVNVTSSSDGSSLVVLPVSNNTSAAINVTVDVHLNDEVQLLRLGRVEPGRVGVKTVRITGGSKPEQTVRAGAYIGAA
jgi:hypothetical protein